MAFLRSIASSTTSAVAASALPAAIALFPPSPSSPSPQISRTRDLSFLASTSLLSSHRLSLVRSVAPPPFALSMDAPAAHQNPPSQETGTLPELLTEFMVDMKCDGCVSAVKSKLQTVTGVKTVEVDLSNQVVRVLGSSLVKDMSDALALTGRKARLIGQGLPEDFLVSAAVAEFKGPNIFGVVRLAQVSMELARIEANFSGLSPGKHSWSINEFGDLTKGAASTGKVYSPTNQETGNESLGDLGTLEAAENGEAFFSGAKPMLKVADLIGRSLVVYETEDKSDSGIAAAVIARSAGVGENYKKICTCDGTTIWESTNADFVPSKV